MKVVVNGEERELRRGTTVADLVESERGGRTTARGVAVAVDTEVVPRSAWPATELSEGQRVELLAPMQGGS
jgi:sulfur carrier protein